MLLTAAAAIALHASTANSQTKRQAWEWTTDERIAMRCDRQAAQSRVEHARAHGRAPTVVRGGKRVWHEVTDIIIGAETPQLLLPSEVFESVVRNGFLVEGWRDAYAAEIIQSGLPPRFWTQLESISGPYIADLRERATLEERHDVDARMLLGALEPRLCSHRAAALANAHAAFGSAIDIFMYRHVAPTKSLFIDHFEDPAALRSREQGCE